MAVDHGAKCGSTSNAMQVCDSVFDKLAEDAVLGTTIEEMKANTITAEMYTIEQHWVVVGFDRYQATFWWPWIGGYRGEHNLRSAPFSFFPRLWVGPGHQVRPGLLEAIPLSPNPPKEGVGSVS